MKPRNEEEARGSGLGARGKNPELLVQFDTGRDHWDERRVSLPEGLKEGRLEFGSPGLVSCSWTLALLRTRARILCVGTLGAVWREFDINDAVQLWIPGKLSVPEGVVVEVTFAEEGT